MIWQAVDHISWPMLPQVQYGEHKHRGDRNPSWQMGQEKLEGLESRVPELKLQVGPESEEPCRGG